MTGAGRLLTEPCCWAPARSRRCRPSRRRRRSWWGRRSGPCSRRRSTGCWHWCPRDRRPWGRRPWRSLELNDPAFVPPVPEAAGSRAGAGNLEVRGRRASTTAATAALAAGARARDLGVTDDVAAVAVLVHVGGKSGGGGDGGSAPTANFQVPSAGSGPAASGTGGTKAGSLSSSSAKGDDPTAVDPEDTKASNPSTVDDKALIDADQERRRRREGRQRRDRARRPEQQQLQPEPPRPSSARWPCWA